MNKLNLPPFYVGQKVIYITGYNMPKNSVHVVLDIWQVNCGCWFIDVLKSPNHGQHKQAVFFNCVECNNIFASNKPEKQGVSAKSFRAIEEANPPLMTFTQIKETEKEEILTLN